MHSVFLTGIEGFVGSHLARHLADKGYSVSGIYFVDPVADLSFAHIVRCDVRDAGELRREMAAVKPDFVIHLAGISSVVIAEQNLTEAFQVNVRGTLSLLEAIQQLQLSTRMLLVSSSEVYDRQTGKGAKLDEQAAVKPLNHYSFTKLCAEQTGRYFIDRYGQDIVILRPFSHTGPGQSTNFVFPSVAHQIAEVEAGTHRPEIEVGNTEVGRDYTDIRDICHAYELALTRTRKGETYNITSEQVLKIGAGINYLVSLSRTPITVKVDASRKRQENVMLAGSSAKFRAATGWKAQYEIKQSLCDLLEYERQRLLSAPG
jgi:GDP-4-dehydro-6-deoxy-D-mannose reductase